MDKKMMDAATHFMVLAVLIIVLIGTLMFTGIIGCNSIPGGCSIYYQLVREGKPNVLVVYGEGGMGDSQELLSVLNTKDFINANAKSLSLEKLTYGNINDYDLIIVEDAKKICTEKLSMFVRYVSTGGRLVWTGDAGTEKCAEDSYLLESQMEEGGEEKIVSPLARNSWGKQLIFDEFLGVRYRGNYCELTECRTDVETGRIEITDDEHKLTYGLSPSIPFYGDFAITEAYKSGPSRIVATLNYGTDLLGKATNQPWLESGKQYNFGKDLPFIVSSQVGGRVAYYAAPLEKFVSEEQPQKNKALLEQMYYGMLFS